MVSSEDLLEEGWDIEDILILDEDIFIVEISNVKLFMDEVKVGNVEEL